jgi:hypothetical protein
MAGSALANAMKDTNKIVVPFSECLNFAWQNAQALGLPVCFSELIGVLREGHAEVLTVGFGVWVVMHGFEGLEAFRPLGERGNFINDQLAALREAGGPEWEHLMNLALAYDGKTLDSAILNQVVACWTMWNAGPADDDPAGAELDA